MYWVMIQSIILNWSILLQNRLSRLIQIDTRITLMHYWASSMIDQALNAFKELCSSVGYNFRGSLEQNWLFPSGMGAIRPTCLAPEMMVAGDLRNKDPILVIGFDGYHDFYPELIADNLTAQGFLAAGLSLALPALQGRGFITSRVLAEMFDQLELCEVLRKK